MTERHTAPMRRRGDHLEHALLAATWEELLAVGYANLTMDGVAARAHTSKPVLYRRWPTRPELVLAARGKEGIIDVEFADGNAGACAPHVHVVIAGAYCEEVLVFVFQPFVKVGRDRAEMGLRDLPAILETQVDIERWQQALRSIRRDVPPIGTSDL